MGSSISKARLAMKQALGLIEIYEAVYSRLQASPGIPDPYKPTTLSFWTVPRSPISVHPGDDLPEYADVVIIGAGITGTSVAYNILDFASGSELKIVMLEAREACSGATGRNGGHINPPLWHDYAELKSEYGEQEAKTIIKFRLAHLTEMRRVAEEEGLVETSQVRDVETVDVYFDEPRFAAAKDNLAVWKAEMSVEAASFASYEKTEAIQRFGLASDVVGCIFGFAGAIHPYRFVTSLLSILLKRHPDNFFLATHTPCTGLVGLDKTKIPGNASSVGKYTVITPRGRILTPHVIHATNGWVSHLVEPMRTKVVPVRGNMSAQRPGQALEPSTLNGYRAHIFYKDQGYDYLTQLPDGEHELMFGGGFVQANKNGLSEVADLDDGSYNLGISSHISGVLPIYFGPMNWGAESVPSTSTEGGGVEWPQGRVKALWTGILGISADHRPWVGRLPVETTGRSRPIRLPAPIEKPRSTSAPAEWIAAGYSGEGMPQAWLSGKALAYMVLGVEKDTRVFDWFPRSFVVSEKRRKKAKVEDLLDRYRSK